MKNRIKEIGVYTHIPFCKQKCYYCDFVSFANQEEKAKCYVQKLIKEIEQSRLEKYKIKTIYIGGGTPSVIEEKYIKEIIENILITQENRENIETTIEVNPGTVTKEKLQTYYNCGINRLSIGLQSTNNEILKTIGRIHTYEEFLNTYKMAKKIGFKNINVDLMLALPNQTLEILQDSVKKVIELEPQHISLYSLILEENTILKEKVENKELILPNEDRERSMYWKTKEMLEEAGYNHYEISNFAKKGYESKHNLDCWNQKEYIGFGLAAHSYINKKRYSNTENFQEYINGYKPIIHEQQLVQDEMKEYMLLGLRKIKGVEISKFKEKFIQNPIYIFRKELNKLVEEQLIEIEENTIVLTNKGLDLANLVWEEFI